MNCGFESEFNLYMLKYAMDDMLIVVNHLHDVNELKIVLEKGF